jgi:hypothetical protein
MDITGGKSADGILIDLWTWQRRHQPALEPAIAEK